MKEVLFLSYIKIVLNGGIGLIQMLNSSNIFCLAGGGRSPKYAPNKLLIWDDETTTEVKEIRMKSNIKNTKIKKKFIFVVCEDEITVISTLDFSTIEIISTIENPSGICAIAHEPNNNIFAWPGLEKGQIQIRNFDMDNSNQLIKAHENFIALIEFNYGGDLIATASDKGTLIRIFNTKDKSLVTEVRRGSEKAEIYSISFDKESKFIGVTSDRGTAHLFVVESNKEKKEEVKNTKSIFRGVTKMIGLSSFFSSEWSFTHIRLPQGIKSICAVLNSTNSFIIVTYQGRYIEGKYDIHSKTNKTDCKIQKDTTLFSR